MKRPVRAKYLALQKSGAGGQSLSELENLVLDVVGRDSAYMNGIPNKAGPPSFAKQQTPRQNSTQMSLDMSTDGDGIGNNLMNDTFASNYSQFEPDPSNY